MPRIDIIKLAASVTKSRAYFCHIKWQGRRTCPRCNHRLVYRTDDKYRCKRCWYKFGDFTGTYMSEIRIAPNTIFHLLYLFSLGVQAYRTRFHIGVNLSTVQHAFRVIQESICDSSIADLRLSGKLEIDEASFGGHRKGKRGWGVAYPDFLSYFYIVETPPTLQCSDISLDVGACTFLVFKM